MKYYTLRRGHCAILKMTTFCFVPICFSYIKYPLQIHGIHWPMKYFNSLLPSDSIWRHKSGSIMVQVMVWRQAITWTNIDLSLVRFSGIHLRAISQQMRKLWFYKMRFGNCTLNITTILPGFSGLISTFGVLKPRSGVESFWKLTVNSTVCLKVFWLTPKNSTNIC